jgi:hypothetical protein
MRRESRPIKAGRILVFMSGGLVFVFSEKASGRLAGPDAFVHSLSWEPDRPGYKIGGKNKLLPA